MLLGDVYESTIFKDFIKKVKCENHTVDLCGEISQLPCYYEEWRDNIKGKVLRSRPIKCLKKSWRYGNNFKRCNYFFLIPNRNKHFISSVLFFSFGFFSHVLLYILEGRQHRMDW